MGGRIVVEYQNYYFTVLNKVKADALCTYKIDESRVSLIIEACSGDSSGKEGCA